MRNRIDSGRILITGAGGFIGAGLFEKLNLFNPIGTVTHLNGSIHTANFIEADLRDQRQVKKILNQYRPSTVFHFAAFSSPRKNEENPQLARDSNLGVTRNILDHLPDDAHLVFPSTDKVFDGSHPNPDEEADVHPLWLYAELKYQCEEMIKRKTRKFHIVRLPIVHSSGNAFGASRGSFIDKAIIDLKAGGKVTVFKNVQRCFVRLEELLDLFEIFIHDTNYGTYHVGSKMMSYYDRICDLCDEQGIDWEDKIMPVDGSTDPLTQNLNTEKFKNIFGAVLA